MDAIFEIAPKARSAPAGTIVSNRRTLRKKLGASSWSAVLLDTLLFRVRRWTDGSKTASTTDKWLSLVRRGVELRWWLALIAADVITSAALRCVGR